MTKQNRKSSVKLMLLLLSLITAISCFTGCTPSDVPPAESPIESSGDEITDASETKAPETEPPAVKEAIALIADGACPYTIVRPELASKELTNRAMDLSHELGRIMGDGARVTLSEDWLNPFTGQKPGELEIIVGDCNRDESRETLKNLKFNDWTLDIVGKKLIIAGHNDQSTIAAIDYFLNEILSKIPDASGSLTFTPEDCHVEKAEYKLEDIKIGETSIREYQIVIPAYGSAAEKEEAESLAAYISDTTGYMIEVVKDTAEVSEYEILFGKTNRQESEKLLHDLLYDDYSLLFTGNKVLIGGQQIVNTLKASKKLRDLIEYKAISMKKISLTEKNSYEYKHEYETKEIVLCGSSIKDYTIVYPANDELGLTTANIIKKAIISKCGVSLEVINDSSDAETKKEILVGNTGRTANGGEAASLMSQLGNEGTDGLLAASGKYVLICGGAEGGFGKAVTEFVNSLSSNGTEEKHRVDLPSAKKLKAETEDLRVMSFNIWVGANNERAKKLAKIITDNAPDIIGMQEAQPAPLGLLQKYIGDTYDYVTLERDKGTKESTPIWYNKNKYTLIESGSGWLSDTPNVISKYPESEYIRVYVYVILESKETGARFVHVNTHLDFAAAQAKQTARLLELTSHLTYMPCFYTADWNFTRDSQGYRLMHNAGYVDASQLTDNVHGNGTFPGSGAAIDFCFTSVLNTSVDAFRVVDDHEYSSSASDHYAIVADLKIVK